MGVIGVDSPGKEILLMGNEAIARGALEAGVKFCTGYPGTPSTEIIDSLAEVAKEIGLYVEWSTNEKVALETAAASSLSGLRSICAMKQNGLNVACDFLFNLNLMGISGGLVIVVCDDPGSHSSSNEQDTRAIAKMTDLPLFEPATINEAKDMTKAAFEVSERIENACLLRSVTRISHARGNVLLGELAKVNMSPFFNTRKPRITKPVMTKHKRLHDHLNLLRESFEDSDFNRYDGPGNPRVIIITSGSGWLYSQEAIEMLGLNDKVGLLKFGLVWPLAERKIARYITKTEKILFVEEVDPFLEGSVKEITCDISNRMDHVQFYGKKSGHIPSVGEINVDSVIEALKRILDIQWDAVDIDYRDKAEKASTKIPNRELGFCPGCPHRASLWSIRNALKLDSRDGFVTGDIGCYVLARTSAGFNLSKTGGAMGSGIGLASGFGKLGEFGFSQPVVALCGDSTFFHAAIPALINSHCNNSNIILAVLDNSTTAMTGFQPHPGVGLNALGEETPSIDIEAISKAIGVKVAVSDPFDLTHTREKLLEMLEDAEGVKVLIMRRKCALLHLREEKFPFEMTVDKEICIGEKCGCNRFCTRIFNCPGLIWNKSTGKAEIDEILCVGCGICADICPKGAIVKKVVNN